MAINSKEKSVIKFNNYISSLTFCKQKPNFLLSSSWDGTLSILDRTSQEKSVFNLEIKDPETNFPLSIIQADFLQNSSEEIISLSITNKMRISNMNSTKLMDIPLPFESPIFSFCQVPNTQNNIVLLDRSRNIFHIDIRTPDLLVSKGTSQGDISCVKLVNNLLIGADLDQIYFFDVNDLSKPIKSLIHNNVGDEVTAMDYIGNESIIIGGSEGRISVEFLDNTKGKNYSFKCHRLDEGNVTNVYSVTAICYDPKKRIFYSGGEDGMINSWDYLKKKRIAKGVREPNGISNIAISSADNVIAYSVSSLSEEEDTESKPHYVTLVDINDMKYFSQSKK